MKKYLLKVMCTLFSFISEPQCGPLSPLFSSFIKPSYDALDHYTELFQWF